MRFGILHQTTPLILIELVIYIDKTSLLFHTTKTWRIIGIDCSANTLLKQDCLAKTWRIRIGIDYNASTPYLAKTGRKTLKSNISRVG